jgi:hypothetical protein
MGIKEFFFGSNNKAPKNEPVEHREEEQLQEKEDVKKMKQERVVLFSRYKQPRQSGARLTCPDKKTLSGTPDKTTQKQVKPAVNLGAKREKVQFVKKDDSGKKQTAVKLDQTPGVSSTSIKPEEKLQTKNPEIKRPLTDAGKKNPEKESPAPVSGVKKMQETKKEVPVEKISVSPGLLQKIEERIAVLKEEMNEGAYLGTMVMDARTGKTLLVDFPKRDELILFGKKWFLLLEDIKNTKILRSGVSVMELPLEDNIKMVFFNLKDLWWMMILNSENISQGCIHAILKPGLKNFN